MSSSVPAFSGRVSAEARATFEAMWSVRGSVSMAPPAPDRAPSWRAALNEAFRAPPEVIARFENRVAAAELAGVPVFEVTPRALQDERKVVLYFHGGGYTMGEPEDGLAHGLARATRLRVVTSNYRKAPEHAFPAAQDDALAVYQALGRRFGAANIVVAGCSAGGGLAISMLLRARELGLALPAAVLGVSPWVDLTQTGDSLLYTSPLLEPLGSYTQAGLGEAARAYAGGLDLRDPQLSPLFADYTRGFPPVMLTTGTRDWFLSACAEFSRTLRQANVPVELSVWEGLGHAFETMPIPEALEAHGYMAAFIRRALGVVEARGSAREQRKEART